jgi:Ca2+-binding EF-hand superfamily protein
MLPAASPPATGSRRFGRTFISPMGEPFRAATRGDDALADWFRQADRNHDGQITADEMQQDADRFFAILDTNHDGEVDPDETTHYEEVVAPEIRSGRTMLLGLHEPVTSADTNLDRDVSAAEFRKAAVVRFQALDVDRQGRLTLALIQSERPAPPPRSKRNMDEPGIDPANLPDD